MKAGYVSWIAGVPYPFQNNIRHLPREAVFECLEGLYEASQAMNGSPANFKDWILSIFGQVISDCFMLPYNKRQVAG
ncbi:hypothetical protein [Desulfonatronovibrio magnus]|uniref:hypothetical protein n=1 Tax=Desulfonatronovibrio magnus TaxID=698827 RepID=UPI0005EAD5BC|nr:hypothetical protein [Desulfonatronovibrio magnus]